MTRDSASPAGAPRLRRRLGVVDSVAIGLGSMIGAGIFAALAPAAAAAGGALLAALAVAAVIAYCNATSTARLAAIYPQSGGAYVYGRERLGPFYGYLAGWAFVVGKTASCAAMALTVGAYAWPGREQLVAVVTVLVITAVNCLGVQKSALLTRGIVVAVLLVLATVVVACLVGADEGVGALVSAPERGVVGVLQAAGLLFFAFAGYARIATLGEEVRDPRRTIARAVPIALAVTLVVYALVAVAVLSVLGPTGLAAATDPLAQAVRAAGYPGLEPVVRIAAVVAAAGALLTLVLGVSRTALAMARDRHLPSLLGAVHPRFGVPYRAEIVVGTVVALLAATADLREVIGFSSFAVLVYYLIANLSAWTLSSRPWPRTVALVGGLGCLLLAAFLPAAAVIGGCVVLGAGALVYRTRAALGAPGP